MGFAVSYRTTRPLAPAEADAIFKAADAANQGRSWLGCEPVSLFVDEDDGHLSGGSRLNLDAHWDHEADEPLPEGTLRDVIDILCRLGREYGVDWTLGHDHEPDVGCIRAGVCDERALAQIEALAELSESLGELGVDEEDVREPASGVPTPPQGPARAFTPTPIRSKDGRSGDSQPVPPRMLPSQADFCIVYPPRLQAFRDMQPYVDRWEEEFTFDYSFHPGFDGGGVLRFPLPESLKDLPSSLWLGTSYALNPPYGLVLGNRAGEALAHRVRRAVRGERPPGWAVKAGLAEAVPEMSVAVTAEHLGALGGQRILLVVPKMKRKSLSFLDHLPGWFATFGVLVEGPAPEVLPRLRGEMSDWFAEPSRPMFAFSVSGGQDDVGWQLAVACYVAQYWEIEARGLDSIHLLTDIEDRPNFRANWTSNK
ncbi:hypothetical protein [Paludisphaera soli]|uniref:hypothetical protein n=1 Tax=Paludisphaera soli TaxID=2712865 RepID=UPI0013EBF58D|nr:hypothetical protein [Paludisphaera soli]